MANVDHKEGSALHLRLIDPADPVTADDPLASINVDLVREGFDPSAIADPLYVIDHRSGAYERLTPEGYADIVAGRVQL